MPVSQSDVISGCDIVGMVQKAENILESRLLYKTLMSFGVALFAKQTSKDRRATTSSSTATMSPGFSSDPFLQKLPVRELSGI